MKTIAEKNDTELKNDVLAVNRLWQSAPLTRGTHGRRVSDFGLNANDV